MEENEVGNMHIPFDIVFDILTRVPTRSLFRFRCVCKSFCSLISQPSFTKAHPSKGTGLDHLLVSFTYSMRETYISNLDVQRKANNDDQFEFSLFQYLKDLRFHRLIFMESINGLVCLWDNFLEDVVVCNPFRKEHVILPQHTKKVDPYLTTCCLGFDPITKKHKVLKAQRSNKTRYFTIFTLGIDKSWREVQCCFRFFPIKNNCVHIDGVIYCVNFMERHDHIAAFNVGEESFTSFSFPDGVSLNPRHVTIVEIKGEVALLDHHRNLTCDGKIHMYVLINGSEADWTWILKQTIDLPSEFNNIAETVFFCRFTSTPKGEIVFIPSFMVSSFLELKYLFFFLYDTGKKEWIKFDLDGVFGERLNLEVQRSVWRNLVESDWSLK